MTVTAGRPLRAVPDLPSGVIATSQSDLARLANLSVTLRLSDGTSLMADGEVPTDAATVRAYLTSIADGFHQQLIDLGWFVGGVRGST